MKTQKRGSRNEDPGNKTPSNKAPENENSRTGTQKPELKNKTACKQNAQKRGSRNKTPSNKTLKNENLGTGGFVSKTLYKYNTQ